MNGTWRNCSTCKKPIPFGATYQKCSVSNCRKNVYCSVTCWDVHVPVMNHKSAWAEEETAPMTAEAEDKPRRRIVVSSPKESSNVSGSLNNSGLPQDVLIVVSKMKSYVKARADMNTSGDVADILSDIVRRHIDEAVLKARQDGRKTLMARDF